MATSSGRSSGQLDCKGDDGEGVDELEHIELLGVRQFVPDVPVGIEIYPQMGLRDACDVCGSQQ